jgi:hypothetical protein
MRDIPERLEWRCMVPVQLVGSVGDKLNFIISYNGKGLDIAREIVVAGVAQRIAIQRICNWFEYETEDHWVDLLGSLHLRGRFYGHDRKTKEIRSLWHDMRELGYAVEDDE